MLDEPYDHGAAQRELAEMCRLDLAAQMERDGWLATSRDRDRVTLERDGRRLEVTQPFGGRGHWREIGMPPARRDILDYDAIQRGGTRSDARMRIREQLAPSQRYEAHRGKPMMTTAQEQAADREARRSAIDRIGSGPAAAEALWQRHQAEASRVLDSIRQAERERQDDPKLDDGRKRVLQGEVATREHYLEKYQDLDAFRALKAEHAEDVEALKSYSPNEPSRGLKKATVLRESTELAQRAMSIAADPDALARASADGLGKDVRAWAIIGMRDNERKAATGRHDRIWPPYVADDVVRRADEIRRHQDRVEGRGQPAVERRDSRNSGGEGGRADPQARAEYWRSHASSVAVDGNEVRVTLDNAEVSDIGDRITLVKGEMTPEIAGRMVDAIKARGWPEMTTQGPPEARRMLQEAAAERGLEVRDEIDFRDLNRAEELGRPERGDVARDTDEFERDALADEPKEQGHGQRDMEAEEGRERSGQEDPEPEVQAEPEAPEIPAADPAHEYNQWASRGRGDGELENLADVESRLDQEEAKAPEGPDIVPPDGPASPLPPDIGPER